MRHRGSAMTKGIVVLVIFGATAGGVVYLDMLHSTRQEDRAKMGDRPKEPPKIEVVDPARDAKPDSKP